MSAQVVQTLMVEMDARTIALEEKLAAMEKRLKEATERTTRGAQETAKVAGSIGDKYAHAARQISYAGEAAARTGKISGEAGRQMLGQGANMAMMFGRNGAIAGGVAVVTLAIVEMFLRARREMETTTAKFRSELAAIGRASDIGKLTGKQGILSTLYSGDTFARLEGRRRDAQGEFAETANEYEIRRLGIKGIQEAIAAQQRIKEAGIGARGELTETAIKAGTEIDRLTKLLGKENDPNTLLGKYKLANDLAAGVVGEATRGTASDIGRTAAQKRGEYETFLKELDATLAKTSSSAADAYRAETTAMIDRVKAKIAGEGYSPEQRREVEARLELFKKERDARASLLDIMEKQAAADRAAVAPLADLESLSQQLVTKESELTDIIKTGTLSRKERKKAEDDLKKAQADHIALSERAAQAATEEIARIQAQIAQLRAARATAPEGAEKDIDEAILAKEKRVRELEETIARMKAVLAAMGINAFNLTTKTTDELERQARLIQQGVDGAVQLAQAMGVVDANSAAALRNIGGIAANLGTALKEGPGRGAALVAVLGSIAGLASAAFGDSAADQERKRIARDNTDALRELTKQVGLIGAGIGLSGAQIGSGGSALDRFFGLIGEGVARRSRNALNKLMAYQMTPEERVEIERLAKEFGIVIDGTYGSFVALKNAVDAASGKLAEFSDDFSGVSSWLDFQRRIFGDKGPLQNLTDLLDMLGNGAPTSSRTVKIGGRSIDVPARNSAFSPGIEAILKAGDPNTAEGRAAMRKMIEEYAKMMAAGGGTISAELLGGLTGDEFKDALLQLIDYLNAIDQGGDTGTGGYNVSRTITEVTGDRLAGILTAGNAFHQRTAEAVEQILARIGGPITAPAVGAAGGSFSVDVGGVQIGDIILQTGASVSPADIVRSVAEGLGRDVEEILVAILRDPSGRVMRALDLATQLRERDRSRGRGDNAVS